eukprot:TRINITY_DN9686_c0_g1_i1.p1 TRINITY_DN9686_c0_g1~~TRINITY_DN9686_c0_g1_i1.p1  ORF type:complete len:818 (-),score=133.05 TRINITY_DN9686_c0_g1_i1:863-3316(-)
MEILSFVHLVWTTYLFLVLSDTCTASTQSIGRISPPFQGSQMNWVDNEGRFLLSNSGAFAFGFSPRQDITSFLLGIIHVKSLRVVWTANIGSPVTNSDKFVFGNDGNAYLESGSTVVWSTNTTGKGGATIELQDTGNLVLLSNDSRPLWQSFSNPTDTLLSGQNFTDGMKLTSSPNSNNLVFHLKFESGDLMFYADFVPPQPYWSMQKETRKTTDKVGRDVYSAALVSGSWKAYDRTGTLLWQFIFLQDADPNITWAAVLGDDGSFSFYNLQNGGQGVAENIRIPQDSCQTPESCGPYSICSSNNRCQCPVALNPHSTCNTDIVSNCSSNSSVVLVSIGDGLGYFAIDFVSPIGKSSLEGCKKLCMDNCSCLALFFDEKSGKCFLFDQLGSLQQSNDNSNGYVSYIKISGSGNSSPNTVQEGSSGKKPYPIIAAIALATVLVIAALIYFAVRYIRRKKPSEPSQGSSEEDTFFENLTGMPIRFGYRELQTATNDFSLKLGQGGFGSVYQGVLSDGTQVAVKKLEGIGQGKKEFRAEVSIIGSIHHVHLVRLRGFCAEGMHRLLAYEYMANGSLDRWIFQKGREGFLLDWDKRFSIALATAKGLAYLHEDCNVKIVHCDIKPENVLLDENFSAKVSDFGLAKLMTREQSHVFTTLRGTRGYLAPEWLTNYAISEKSDVYSYGMVLLEIIGGRKNFDPAETSEKAHFPSYAFKKMEEGKLQEIIDAKIQFDETDERVPIAIKAALWCIQEDMRLRPSMTKVVQMLEGLSDVRQPPTSSQLGFRLHSNFLKSVSEEGTSSGPSDCNSNAFQSAVRLSGPR